MIGSKHAHLHVAAASHAGMSGKQNEDRYAVSAHRLSSDNPTPSVLAVVADGIGGHRAGEVAAELAVEHISQAVSLSDAARPIEILHQAITQASQVILEHAEKNPERSGMGSTCVCAWVIGEQLFAAWVGDSRLYLARGGQIYRLTIDHTWVQEALEHGALTPEQARNHPNAHVIRRHLGSKSTVRPDMTMNLEKLTGLPAIPPSPETPGPDALTSPSLRLLPGDRLLLCSDGLTDLVDDAEILQALSSQQRQAAIESLIDLANQRGGHDNITIVVLEVPAHGAAGQKLTRQQSSSQAQRGLLFTCLAVSGLLAFLALVGLLIAWLLWLKPLPAGRQTTPTPTRVMPLPFPSATLPAAAPEAPGNSPSPTLQAPLETAPAKLTAPPTQPAASPTPWPTNTLGPAPTLPPMELMGSPGPP
ncbi:MAG TPA: protein phosphatase 2C domain-containing protein [Anaerolineales bacterium]|nr:protein phosphatase 2C domain-containing protein [Anaerolineales bacterium]